MKRTLFVIAMLFWVSFHGFSGEPDFPEKLSEYRVLLVGDSWSFFLWQYGTMNRMFTLKGRSFALEKGDVTAVNGSKASEWVEPGMLQLIADELTANPTIDVVQLSMGGNDFLSGQPDGWYVTMSPQEEVDLYTNILSNLEIVIQYILAINPGIQIIMGGYDYPNFEESRAGILGFFCTPYWVDMVRPTPFELNSAMTAFEDMLSAYADTVPEFTYVRNLGSMQYLYGFPDQGIPPGTLIPPGDLDLPSPIESMNLGQDCIHLSSNGYDYVALNLWDGFYAHYFCLFLSEFKAELSNWGPTANVLDFVADVERICLN